MHRNPIVLNTVLTVCADPAARTSRLGDLLIIMMTVMWELIRTQNFKLAAWFPRGIADDRPPVIITLTLYVYAPYSLVLRAKR